jgi:hypothetical protein
MRFILLDLICKGVLVGTGHLESSFHNSIFLRKLDIWFANLFEIREF